MKKINNKTKIIFVSVVCSILISVLLIIWACKSTLLFPQKDFGDIKVEVTKCHNANYLVGGLNGIIRLNIKNSSETKIYKYQCWGQSGSYVKDEYGNIYKTKSIGHGYYNMILHPGATKEVAIISEPFMKKAKNLKLFLSAKNIGGNENKWVVIDIRR